MLGCVKQTRGIVVPVEVQLRSTTPGLKVAVTLGELELLACTPDAGLSANVAERFFRMLSDSIVPVARAHAVSSPTQIGTPNVFEADGSGAAVTRSVGTFRPPPGRYCSLRVALYQADPDAVGVPDTSYIMTTLRVVDARGPRSSASRFNALVRMDPALTPPPNVDTPLRLVFDVDAALAAGASIEDPDSIGAALATSASVVR